MIFDRLEHIGKYGKSKEWHEIISQFIRDFPACHDKEGNGFPLLHGAFYNIMSAELMDDNAYEFHKKYTDVHCTIKGVEKIDGAYFSRFVGNGKYSEERDAGFFHDFSEKDCTFYVEPGNCAVFYPYEAHKTLLLDDREKSSPKLKKAIIKIPADIR